MLAIEPFLKSLLIKTVLYEVVIGRPLGGKDRPAVIDQRENYRPLKAFIFGLNVVNNTFKLDICIES